MAFLNKNGLIRLWQNILAKLNTKVDKIDGKGLSTNDYTTDEKNKLGTLNKGVANGIAELDENGKVLASQLPSYDVPAITTAKIDEICGASIYAASEVEV